MRHQYAAELCRDGAPTGKFHYVESRDGLVYPIGYCAGWQPWMDGPDPTSPIHEMILANERLKLKPFKAKFHCDGHASADEACQCYRDYMLDIHAQYNHELVDEQRKCQVCGAWTSKLASVGMVYVALCPAHLAREHLAQFLPSGGSTWVS